VVEENLPDSVDGGPDRLQQAIERYVAACFAASNGDVEAASSSDAEEPDELLAELLALDDFS
jgi:hypothetical protein